MFSCWITVGIHARTRTQSIFNYVVALVTVPVSSSGDGGTLMDDVHVSRHSVTQGTSSTRHNTHARGPTHL